MTADLVLEIPGIPPFLWTYQVVEGDAVVGRGTGSEVTLLHSTVSRHHARILCDRNGLRVLDEDSSNGTFVNGTKVAPYTHAPFKAGDLLTFGVVHLQVTQRKAIPSPSAMSQTKSTTEIDSVSRVEDFLLGVDSLGSGPLRVLPLLLRGYTEKEIAAEIHRGVSTVHTHVHTILRHFGVSSTKKLFAMLIDRSLLAEATDAAAQTLNPLPAIPTPRGQA